MYMYVQGLFGRAECGLFASTNALADQCTCSVALDHEDFSVSFLILVSV